MLISRPCFPTQSIPKCIRFSILDRCPRAVSWQTYVNKFQIRPFFINQMYLSHNLNIESMAYCHSNVQTLLFCHSVQLGLEQCIFNVILFHLVRCLATVCKQLLKEPWYPQVNMKLQALFPKIKQQNIYICVGPQALTLSF